MQCTLRCKNTDESDNEVLYFPGCRLVHWNVSTSVLGNPNVSAHTVSKCMQYAAPKCWYIFTSPYSVIHHNMRVFASNDQRTSNPIDTTRIFFKTVRTKFHVKPFSRRNRTQIITLMSN